MLKNKKMNYIFIVKYNFKKNHKGYTYEVYSFKVYENHSSYLGIGLMMILTGKL